MLKIYDIHLIIFLFLSKLVYKKDTCFTKLDVLPIKYFLSLELHAAPRGQETMLQYPTSMMQCIITLGEVLQSNIKNGFLKALGFLHKNVGGCFTGCEIASFLEIRFLLDNVVKNSW